MKNLRIAILNISLMQKRMIFLLGIIYFFSSVLSPSPILSLMLLIKIIELSLLVIIFLKHRAFFRKHSYLLWVPVLFESLIAIVQFIFQHSIGGLFYLLGERSFTTMTPNIADASIGGQLILRPYATFSHPNVLAAFLVISMIILILNQESKGIKVNILIKISLITGSLALLLTMSRIAIVVFGIFVFYRFLKQKKFKKNLIEILILAIFAAAFIFSSLHLRFILTANDSSIVERVALMNSSILMIKENPIFGVGPNNFLSTLPNYFGPRNLFSIQPVHNIPLLIASQVGIVAVIIIFYFLFVLFRNVKKENRTLLIVVFVLSLFDHYFLTIQQGQFLLALALVYVLSDSQFDDRILI